MFISRCDALQANIYSLALKTPHLNYLQKVNTKFIFVVVVVVDDVMMLLCELLALKQLLFNTNFTHPGF